ncbi:oxidoreductase [Marinihelvus fidelis]|uniref:Oxidoreductase n=1 Tax=Marinihelvus fidelis TaxID=2613842 RepID=A0A5N0TB02_9GAMM|nr:aldo/keto reductase [Marinihelvus fidelis]KAA9131931.1 oxidoreductase [Marinihelvus fidelis]
MNPTPLGPNGPHFSPLIQGYWRLDEWGYSAAELLDFIKGHVDLGITTVDHAAVYGGFTCEEQFGDALALDPALRERLQVVTKFGIHIPSARFPDCQLGHYDTDAETIIHSVEASLSNLRTDRIDLLLLHRPDPLLNASDVANAFEQLHASGKVLHFGVSNFTPRQFELLQSALSVPLVTNQVEINPLNDAVLWDGTLDQAQQQGVRPMAWSCLAGGRIFDANDEDGARLWAELKTVGEELGGASPDQVAYAWALRLPSRPLPIIGSGNLGRVRATVGALSLQLNREQWFRILAAGQGAGVP